MNLAGEAGSLLKIEEEIAGGVAEAKERWLADPHREQQRLFVDGTDQSGMKASIDISDIADDEFWDRAEDRIYAALRSYAEHIENGGGAYQRRLFANDTARGFAFVDLCGKRYDVALMNPPFGEATKASKAYITDKFKNSSADILQAFVERVLGLLTQSGRVGAISARTGFFLGNSKSWRSEIVFKNRLICFADLGLGVLDDALVEVASYVIEKAPPAGSRIDTDRQLDNREKGGRLLRAIEATQRGDHDGLKQFDQHLLALIPDHTFAYWAPESLVRRYSTAEKFRDMIGKVRQGVATADDFRFARLGWEVDTIAIGPAARWQRFSKGGEYSPPYDDIHLLVDWGKNGEQLKAFPGCFIRNEAFYFMPGATYTVRTASAFAAKVLPAECIFSHNAQTWFSSSPDLLLLSVGYLSARVPQAFLELAVGSGDIATAGSAARRYTTAVVESVPAGVIREVDNESNRSAVRTLFHHRVSEFQSDETSCHFSHFHLSSEATGLRNANHESLLAHLQSAVHALGESGQLDDSITGAFRLTPEEQKFVDEEVGVHPTCYVGNPRREDVVRLFGLTDDASIAEAIGKLGSRRWFTKKSYFVDRRLEMISHYLQASPAAILASIDGHELDSGLEEYVRSAVSEALGISFGRWDLRFATGHKSVPILPDPFAPLPGCPPGQLQNEQGLPIIQADVAGLKAEGRWHYPIEIPWDGILVDDDIHRADVEARIHQVLEEVWPGRSESIEHEVCEILGVRTLRDYFRKSSSFFADHLKRYSKSRRQAPIYWPLSTPSGSYTLWLYYHRLTDQTLYTCVNDFIEPKLMQVAEEVASLRTKSGRSSPEERELERLSNSEAELKDFRDELLRIAKFWKPNLNDGVQITAAPLWKLFQHKPWQRKLKEAWDKLKAGEYDWAHLAYSIWPDRVREKCRTDKSLAIAHGLEDLYEEPKTAPKKKRARRKHEEDEEFAAMDLEG
jgi:hypothetical protein